MNKIKIRILLGDLGYFNEYTIPFNTIPLNVGYLSSYVNKLYGTECDILIFKDPEKLLAEARRLSPDIVGLSCYYWNTNLDILVSDRIKKLNPDCVVVVGGPNVDTDEEVQRSLFESFKGNADFLIVNEGEIGFANIVGKLLNNILNKNNPIDGCITFIDNKRIFGNDVGLSLDLEELPSPILSGILDEFLTQEFMPLIQTSRMCPYSCTYCCSGKLTGKIRTFPISQVKKEIEYLANKYQNYPHRILEVTDENFGINKRDVEIAKHIYEVKENLGFPKQVFCYFDKHLTDTVKKCISYIADMNSGGVQLAFQTFNEKTLKTIKRKNVSKEQINEVISWAHTNNLQVYSEVIFGLPFETKDSFLEALEYLMQQKIDSLLAYNLILFKGIILNRKPERDKFGLKTMFRPVSSFYDILDSEFVCESEEVAVSSNDFSFNDYMVVRKISFLFYLTNNYEYFKKVINYLIDEQYSIVSLFEKMMNIDSTNKDFKKIVEDFLQASESELFTTHFELSRKLESDFRNNENKVLKPNRLNNLFSSQFIYGAKCFGEILNSLIDIESNKKTILADLINISENEFIDIKNPAVGKTIIVSAETLKYLNMPLRDYVTENYYYKMSPSADQVKKLIT